MVKMPGWICPGSAPAPRLRSLPDSCPLSTRPGPTPWPRSGTVHTRSSLHGTSTTIAATSGEVLGTYPSQSEPLGSLHVRCGNRRASVCPSCSRLYAADTFQMIRAGVTGGKTVPESVADNPLVFATLTPPSFGHVHAAGPKGAAGGRCRPRAKSQVCEHGARIGCMEMTRPTPSLGNRSARSATTTSPMSSGSGGPLSCGAGSTPP